MDLYLNQDVLNIVIEYKNSLEHYENFKKTLDEIHNRFLCAEENITIYIQDCMEEYHDRRFSFHEDVQEKKLCYKYYNGVNSDDEEYKDFLIRNNLC